MEKKYVICRTCGYIMEEGELHDVCPACGVPARAFEPYKPRVNEKRRKLLELHMHPIILHFPQAVVVFATLLFILTLFLQGDWKEYALIVAKFHTFLLPLCVLGGVATGMLDGKIRYKSLNRPALKKKIVLSCVFFLLTVIAALVLLLAPFTMGINLLLILLEGAATLVAVVLGRTGARLMGPAFPG